MISCEQMRADALLSLGNISVPCFALNPIQVNVAMYSTLVVFNRLQLTSL